MLVDKNKIVWNVFLVYSGQFSERKGTGCDASRNLSIETCDEKSLEGSTDQSVREND